MTKDEVLDLALDALTYIHAETSTEEDELIDRAITAIKQARALDKKAENARELGLDYEPVQEPVAWPVGLIDRIKAAEQRIQDGHAPRRIPADPTDVDLVLAEVRYLLEGKQPPFWIKTTPPAAQPETVQEPVGEVKNLFTQAAWEKLDVRGSTKVYLGTPPAQPAPVQEPVETGDTLFRQFMSEAEKAGVTHWPTPPVAQRQWVGLTDEDIEQEFGFIDELLRDCVHRTEAKLRSKNNG